MIIIYLLFCHHKETGSLTEDMIKEQEELFEHLGSSEDATRQRAQLQSRHLQSGKIMVNFK